MNESPQQKQERPLAEVARLFLRLGFTAFGGPAAHIAMMEDEVVERRGWLSRQHFLDLVGATNLIPGPNSTEMTMHIGYERAGWRGLVVAGVTFLGPAVLLTGILAWLYVTYGQLPQAAPFLTGIKPAVLSIILAAVWKLGKKAVKGWRPATIGAIVLAAALWGFDVTLVLLLGGFGGAVWLYLAGRENNGVGKGTAVFLPPSLWSKVLWGAAATATAVDASLWRLFLVFLKIGSIMYGSGYVLVAFLERDLVERLGWLTQTQLLDAIAIGQFTPGPILSTATFIGYLVAGPAGAVVATLGIFLPSFLFVLLLNPLIPRLRQMRATAAFLDAVNVAAVALMAAVTINLAQETLVNWQAWLIAVLAALLTFRFKVNSAWLVLGGAALGYALWLLTGSG